MQRLMKRSNEVHEERKKERRPGLAHLCVKKKKHYHYNKNKKQTSLYNIVFNFAGGTDISVYPPLKKRKINNTLVRRLFYGRGYIGVGQPTQCTVIRRKKPLLVQRQSAPHPDSLLASSGSCPDPETDLQYNI